MTHPDENVVQADLPLLVIVELYDPTPWCGGCKSMTMAGCDCGPIAEND